ncbi:MAG: FKBP-type peptidyl-prolyl cis-trans isomerase, partial [Lachnospiraceae bacterium]
TPDTRERSAAALSQQPSASSSPESTQKHTTKPQTESTDGDPENTALTSTLLDDAAEVSDKNLSDNDWSTFLDLTEYKNLVLRCPDDTVAQSGDTVNIDYAGTIDGEAFDGGTGNYDLVLGSHSFIDGFENQLIGHKAGDFVDVVCTFPEVYSATDLAGKEAHFATTVNYVQKMSPTQAFLYVVNTSKIKNYPADLHKNMLDLLREVFTHTAETYSMTYSEVLDAYGYEEDIITREDTKAWIVAKAVLQSENMTKDDDFYKEAETTVLAANGYGNREDAIAADMPEAYIDYQTDIAVAMNLIERLSQNYVEPTEAPAQETPEIEIETDSSTNSATASETEESGSIASTAE